MNYYTRERLGPKQETTPEGFLLCRDVPIARTGMMLYGAGEIPVDPGPDGLIYVERHSEDVFRQQTIDSFNGKPVVNGHPDEDVKPHNWRNLASGVVMNPHRGEGTQDDVLMADLLITHHEELDAIRHGLREVSCGYDAKYLSVPDAFGHDIPGKARQVEICGNHVALVEAGRCGSRCAIGDHISEAEKNMTWKERLQAAFKSKDEAAYAAVLAEVPDGTATHVHVHGGTQDSPTKTKDTMDAAIDARFKGVEDSVASIAKDVKTMKDEWNESKKDEDEDDEEDEKKNKKTEDDENEKIAGDLEEEAPPGTSHDAAVKSRDSAFLVDSFQETVALAEIIAPGVGIPTLDAKAAPAKTLDAMCRFRRTVLDLAHAQPETRVFMDSLTGGRDFKTYDCARTRTLFRSVGQFKKTANSRGTTTDEGALTAAGGGLGVKGKMRTPADLNKRLQEIYSTKG